MGLLKLTGVIAAVPMTPAETNPDTTTGAARNGAGNAFFFGRPDSQEDRHEDLQLPREQEVRGRAEVHVCVDSVQVRVSAFLRACVRC